MAQRLPIGEPGLLQAFRLEHLAQPRRQTGRLRGKVRGSLIKQARQARDTGRYVTRQGTADPGSAAKGNLSRGRDTRIAPGQRDDGKIAIRQDATKGIRPVTGKAKVRAARHAKPGRTHVAAHRACGIGCGRLIDQQDGGRHSCQMDRVGWPGKKR